MNLKRDEVVTLFSGVVGHVFGAVVVVALTLVTVYLSSGVIGTENPAQSSSLPVAAQTVQNGALKEASAGNGSGGQPGGQSAEALIEPAAGAGETAVETAYAEDPYEETAEGYYDD